MLIKVTFGGALVRYLPAGSTGNRQTIETATGITLFDLLEQFGIPDHQRLLVILNGSVVKKEAYPSTLLSESDDLSLMPPIQAG